MSIKLIIKETLTLTNLCKPWSVHKMYANNVT